MNNQQTKKIKLPKRILSAILCIAIIFGIMPMSAFAAGGGLTHDRNGTRYTYTIGYMYSGSQGGINTREIFTAPDNYAVWLCPVCGQGGGSSGTNLAENLYMPCYAYDVAATGGTSWIRYALVRHRHNNGSMSDYNVYVPINVAMYSGCYYGYDLTNPSGSSISAPTGWQKNSARVTFSGGTDTGTALPIWASTPGNYGSGIHHYEYSLDGGVWTGCPTNDASVTITKSGATTVRARAVDGAGNASTEIATATVYVDSTAPNTPTITPSTTSWSNQNVSVTIKDNGDAHSGVARIESSVGGAYSTYSSALTISTHGVHTVSARVVDNVGFVSAVASQSVYIDKVAPTITTINQTLNSNLTLTINITSNDADSGVKGYAVTTANTAPSASTFKTTAPVVDKNGTYYVWVIDNAGNISRGTQVRVTALDSVPPVVTSVETQKTWDATQNYAKITATDDNSGVEKIGWASSPTGTITWQNATSSHTFQFTNNGTYYAFAMDMAGNVSESVAFTINRIDKVNPLVDSAEFNPAWSQSKTIEITGADQESGVAVYALTTTTTAPSTWQNQNVFANITENGTYYAWVKDNVERVSTPFAVKIETIDRTSPEMDDIVHSSSDNAPAGVFSYPLFNVVDYPTLTARDEIGIKEIQYQFVEDGANVQDSNWQVYNDAEKPAMTAEFIGTVVGKAIDFAGNESEIISSKFLFEETKPLATTLLSDYGWTNGEVSITVNADDDFSGVRDITLPNGTTITSDTVQYTVDTCGVYDFIIRDNCGNILIYPVTISIIDLIAPELTHTLNPDTWTNDTVVIELTATDSAPDDGYTESGIDFITLPDGTKVEDDTAEFEVDENGWYEFEVTDKAGNSSTHLVEVKNLDHLAPIGEYSISPDIWTNETVTITITATDPSPENGYDESGIDYITLPDGTKIEDDTAEFVVEINDVYEFSVTDKAGNETIVLVPIENIDLVKPKVEFHFEHINGVTYEEYGSLPEYYNKDITLVATAKDDASGIHSYEYKVDNGSWNIFTTDKPPVFDEEQRATISVRVWDVAGNVSDEKVREFLLDKTPPTATHTLTNNKGGTITINFGADTSIAGVGSIVKPDNSVVYAVSTTTYEVSKNGEYPFVVWDRCGNQTEYTVPITQLSVAVTPQQPEQPSTGAEENTGPDIKPDTSAPVESETITEPKTALPRLTIADLFLTLLSILFAVISLLRLRKRKELYSEKEETKEETEETHSSLSGYGILSTVLALLSIILFFVTQPLVWRFRLVDIWTIFFAILALGNLVSLCVSRKKGEEIQEEETCE